MKASYRTRWKCPACRIGSHRVMAGDTTSRSSALAAFIAEGLQRHLAHDQSLHAACESLHDLGVKLTVRIELVPGREGVKVEFRDGSPSVSEWNEGDRELLRTLGIASDKNAPTDQPVGKSRRRQPR